MPQLDGLRAVAILLVLFNRWLPLHLTERVPFGVTGVFIFFVISGFLITRILLESRSQHLRQALGAFYARRVLRIFPAYYLVVGAFTLLGVEVMRETAVWNLTYTTNFFVFTTGVWPTWASHFWSLAIEEQFYLFWPLLLLLLPRRLLPAVLVAAICISPLLRCILVFNGYNTAQITTLPFCALDFLGIGALLAVFWGSETLERIKPYMPWAAAAGLAVFSVACFFGKSDYAPGVFAIQASAVPFFAVYLVSKSATGWKGVIGSVLQWKPVVYIGRISYGIYLLYGFITLVRMRIYDALGLEALDYVYLNLVVNICLNIALAALMFELFESRILQLKRYFRYRKQSGDESQQASGASSSATSFWRRAGANSHSSR